MALTDGVVTDPSEQPTAPAAGGLDAALARARDVVRRGAVREGLAQLTALRRSASSPGPRAVVLALLVHCRLARGDLAEAMVLGDELTPLLEAGGEVAALAHHAKGELAEALGDPELARAHYLTVGQLRPDIDPDLAPWRSSAALAQVRAGQAHGAAELARRGLAVARADGRPHVVAAALRVLAVVDVGSDRPSHLRTARALLPDGTADRLAAQIDTDLAGLLVLSPHATEGGDALALLRSAEGPACREELWPMQGRIQRLLELLGETPRRVNSEAVALLTAAEHRVAELAAQGLTNKQVAAELGVGVKAVEWHLGHVYRKLAIPSRAHLAEVLGSSG